jgi:hypothetical protein
MSDDDSGIGFDHQTLNHVIGVTAEDALGEDSSHWSHFKAVPTKRKSLSNKKARKKKLVGINKKQPKPKVFFSNSKGLQDMAKSRFISETTREENLDFIYLQETGRNDFCHMS